MAGTPSIRRLAACVALVAVIGLSLLFVMTPSRDERGVRRALASYLAAVQSGDPKQIALETGPKTRAWHDEMRQAALTENRAQVQQRGCLEMIQILDLRSRKSVRDLTTMSNQDLLMEWERERDTTPRLILTRIQVKGDTCIARLERPGKRPGEKLFLGEDDFFTRNQGRWYFEPHALDEAIMSRVTTALPQPRLIQLVRETMQGETGKPFDERWWDRPSQ